MSTKSHPDFLARHHETGKSMIEEFNGLTREGRIEIDRWLLVNRMHGLTWQEDCLFAAIENEEVDV